MPTVVTSGPFRIRVLNPPREHGPAHVHVVHGPGRGTSEALVNLGAPAETGGPWGNVSLREVKGMRSNDVVHAVRLVHEHRVELRRAWIKLHGQP